jgi:hypothetical protein
MRITKGECKINGIHVTEVTIKNLHPTSVGVQGQEMSPVMEAVYATIEGKEEKKELGTRSSVVHTHGRCTAYPSNWSKDTLQLLRDLLESMEIDLLPRHFSESVAMEQDDARIESERHEEARQV